MRRCVWVLALCVLALQGCAGTALERYLNKDNVLLSDEDFAKNGGRATLGEQVTEPLCVGVDWHAIGKRDGQMWRDRDVADIYARNCGPAGVVLDAKAYRDGYDESVTAFCTYDRGVEFGKAGKVFAPCLKPGPWAHFSDGFEQGLKYFCTRAQGTRAGEQGHKDRACTAPKWVAYAAGYQQGLARYCTSDLGYRTAAAGDKYPEASCPSGEWAVAWAGYQEGLKAYCTAELAQRLGAAGQDWPNVCTPKSDWPDFQAAYHAGLERYCSYDRGLRTGSEGNEPISVCLEPGLPEWQRGYRVGTVRYCAAQGMEFGLDGRWSSQMPSLCHQAEAAFQRNYDAGRLIAQARERVDDAARVRDAIDDDFARLDENSKDPEKAKVNAKAFEGYEGRVHAAEDDLRYQRRRRIEVEKALAEPALSSTLSALRNREEFLKSRRDAMLRASDQPANPLQHQIRRARLRFVEEDLRDVRDRLLNLEALVRAE